MSAQYGNADNRANKERVNKDRLDQGDCTHCPPRRGENPSRRHVRWIDGQPIKRKNKEQK